MLTSISNFTHNNINNIFNYAENISSRYATKVVNNIYRYIDTLKVFPYIGRRVVEISNKEYRERIYKNCRIVYQPFERKEYVKIKRGKMTETKIRLINVMEKLPNYVYEEKEDLKLIMEIAKKYYQEYQDDELKQYVEDYIKYEKEMKDDNWKSNNKV